MVNSKVISKKKTSTKQKSGTARRKPVSKESLIQHKSKLLMVVLAGIVLLVGYFSLSRFMPAAAETAQVSWTSGDPIYAVDPDQTKTAPAPCAETDVILGNDENASSVCVIQRDTWRYGKYTRNVCRWGSCTLEQGYAIGYGDDAKMYRMRNMPEFWAPYLVPGSNTMAVRDINYPYFSLGLIKDFHLRFDEIAGVDGSKEYSYDGSDYFKFATPDGSRIKVQAVGASSNGKWLVAEAPDVGLFRINLETLDTKRFSTFVHDYWSGTNPNMEMAVSNDGYSVAAMGVNAVFTTYTVNESCGDKATDSMTKSTPISNPCPQKDMVSYMSNNVAGFRFGSSPSFDENAGILTLQAHYRENDVDGAKWVSLTFASSPDAGDGNCLMTGEIGSADTQKCCVTNRSYPLMIRQMMGKQAEKMKITCSSADSANDAAWTEWQNTCLSLETALQEACKGITFEEFKQMYKGGSLKEATSNR